MDKLGKKEKVCLCTAVMLSRADVLSDERWWLTGRGCLAHKGHQLLFDLLEGVQVVHEEDVSVAGFTGDAHQLAVVGISEAEREHDVTFTGRQGEKKCLSSTWKQPEGERERNTDVLTVLYVWFTPKTALWVRTIFRH